jgi:putative tRNA adenosine deaminase-associated protein
MASEDVDAAPIDFAVACWREERQWTVLALPERSTSSAEALVSALRQFPGEGGVFGFVSVSDEFFVAVRQAGDHTRAFISDGTCILDFELAEELAELIGLDVDEDDLEDFEPVGDLALFADFGLDATEVSLLCGDTDLYPDEQVRMIAKRVGFLSQLTVAMPTG